MVTDKVSLHDHISTSMQVFPGRVSCEKFLAPGREKASWVQDPLGEKGFYIWDFKSKLLLSTPLCSSLWQGSTRSWAFLAVEGKPRAQRAFKYKIASESLLQEDEPKWKTAM